MEKLLRNKLKDKHGSRYHFSDDGRLKFSPDDALLPLFQSVREHLITVIRHAQAREVSLDRSRQRGCISIVLADDGVGFDVDDVLSSPPQHRGVGLFNTLERLDYIGGKLNMESHLGDGTRFTLIALSQYTLHAAKEPHDGSENRTR